MDKFLVKKLGNVSAKERSSLSKDLYEDGGKLFCRVCNVVLDHTRKSTVNDHLTKSKKHLSKKVVIADMNAVKRQTTITTTLHTKTVSEIERIELCHEWIKVCTACNIPLSKTDHPALREFINKRVVNGGAIPSGIRLHEVYLFDVYSIAVVFDELSDLEGRFVLNILFAPLESDELHDGKVIAYLADTVFLDKTNHATVSQSVVGVLHDYDINFDNVLVFDTDNAEYMKKAFNTVLSGLCTNAIHITCLAHIMSLIGQAFRKPFKEASAFVKRFSNMFFHAGSRKARFRSFLMAQKTPDDKSVVTMPPDPCSTRWNSWFECVQYHQKHFDLYKEFSVPENEIGGRRAPESVKDLNDMLTDDQQSFVIKCQLDFISEKCTNIMRLNDFFQSRVPCTLRVFEILEELMLYFVTHSDLTLASTEHIMSRFDEMTLSNKSVLLNSEAFFAAQDKLEKYLGQGQPGLPFLKAVRLFDPKQIVLLEVTDKSSYDAIPGMFEVSMTEFAHYTSVLGPQAVRAAGESEVDLDLFWISVADKVPDIARLAKRYKNAVTNSADAERSFSLYNLILTGRRRSLTPHSLKALVSLYHNERLKYSSFVNELVGPLGPGEIMPEPTAPQPDM